MEGRPKRESIASRIFEKHALPGTLPMIVLSPAFGFAIFFVGLYGASLGVGNAGLFYTLSAVSMILVRLKSGAFMDRFAPIVILPVALACGLVALPCSSPAGRFSTAHPYAMRCSTCRESCTASASASRCRSTSRWR